MRPTWTTLLLALLGAHVLFGAARLPFKVWGERLHEVSDYGERGGARYFLDSGHERGAEVVEWLQQHTPRDAVVLWRGDSKGSMEFVPALLAPRLLVREDACRKDAERYLDRPLARLEGADGAPGPVLVVVGHVNDLTLEAR